MLRDKLFYYLANYTLQHTFEKEIVKFINSKKRLVIFDVGCYRGIFTKTIFKLIGKKKYKFYLFDINKRVKKYISNLLKLKNIYYNEIALSNKNGNAYYNFNRFFESAGSSLSNIVKNDNKWNFSRKLFLKILLFKPQGFIKYKGSVSKIIYKLVGGLRSSMGYLGCKQIKNLKKNPKFVKITKAGFYESMVHNIDKVIR